MNSLLQSVRQIVTIHAIMLAASPVLFSKNAAAQSTSAAESNEVVSSSPSAPNTAKPRNQVETSVSVGSMAQLTATRVNDTKTSLTTVSLAPSAGAFATLRQTFKPWLGYSVNFGYTYPNYRYTVSAPTSSTGTTSRALLQAHMYEVSVSYIAQKYLTNHFAVFGEAGGGTVGFAANNTGGYLPNRSNAFRSEGIAGFGVDYRLTHGLGLRAQYRVLFIRFPYPNDALSPKQRTIISEPTLSLTYTFGKHDHR